MPFSVAFFFQQHVKAWDVLAWHFVATVLRRLITGKVLGHVLLPGTPLPLHDDSTSVVPHKRLQARKPP